MSDIKTADNNSDLVDPVLWIAGKVTNVLSDGWDFIGVFSDEPKAIAAIQATFESDLDSNDDANPDRYFIAPATVDALVITPDGSDWEGGYFPLEIPSTTIDLFAEDSSQKDVDDQ